MRKLRCFIAMAFGNKDTDAVFKRIKGELPHINIRRVDRINHNNDIDDQILTELKNADFVITDLTYARPSAYWEAGYAQGRPIPVIYTTRADHIDSKQHSLVMRMIEQWPADERRDVVERLVTDAHRVHFDLKMRNIITWITPADQSFLRTLKTRIKLVTTPLLQRQRETVAQGTRRKDFARLSQSVRIERITDAAIAYFKENGFQLEYKNVERNNSIIGSGYRARHFTHALRRVGNTLEVVAIDVRAAQIASNLRSLKIFESWRLQGCNLNILNTPPKRIECMTFIFALDRIRENTLRKAFPSAEWDANMTGTLPRESRYLPNHLLWESGKKIKASLSHFEVGGKDVAADAKGTFVDRSKPTKQKSTRIGNAIKCQFVSRYCVISGITDPWDIPQQMSQRFGDAK